MFTGIITNLATLKNLEFNAKKDAILILEIEKSNIKRSLKIGCSIACNGICLTLISQKIVKNNLLLSFQASQENLTLKNIIDEISRDMEIAKNKLLSNQQELYLTVLINNSICC